MGAVVAFKQNDYARSLRLVNPGDELVNNTDHEIRVTEANGSLIELLRPGHIFRAERPMTVYFAADATFSFRSYINQETPDEYVY